MPWPQKAAPSSKNNGARCRLVPTKLLLQRPTESSANRVRVSIPRLRSVRLKSGGATLRVFDNQISPVLCQDLKTDIREIIEKRKTDMDGFAVVAWSRSGDVSSSVRVRSGRYVGRSEVAGFVRSAVFSHIFGCEQ